MTVKISVVMSVFNGAAHLAETLESILAQTEPDFEVIVVDDGSTDGSPAILEAFANRDARMRVVRQENRGLTLALIAGCAAAKGTYVARHDVGDTSHRERFAVQRRMLDETPAVAFVSCATQYVGPESEPLWIAHPRGPALEPASIIDLSSPLTVVDGPTHHGSVMFRRDVYERAGGYRDAFYYAQDFDLWFRLAETGLFQTTEQVLYTARIAPGSISGSAKRQQERLARLSRAALEARRRGEGDAPIIREAAALSRVRATQTRRARAAALYFIGEALRRNRDPRARAYLRRALGAWPLSPRAWVRFAQSLLL